MKKLLGWVVVLGVLAAAGAGFVYRRIVTHAETSLGLSAPLTVNVKRGQSLKSIIDELANQGVWQEPNLVYYYARLKKVPGPRTGEYLVVPDDSPKTVLEKLAAGRVKTEQFAVIEGHNRWQVRDSLARARWMTAAEFDRLCEDTGFLAKHQIPGPTCEGYLFPDTYTFARGLAPEAVLGTMFAMFHKVFTRATETSKGPLAFDMQRFVTLASIVEKETGAKEERPRIACVFYNRLQAKPMWRLETDPTVIYAATLSDPKFDGNIKRSHLRELKHPYNTYHVFGLPPGPIANPGRAALTAVANPMTCGDFFFVSRNDGTHIFCPTLDCHNKAVTEWQINYFRKKK